MFAAQNMTFAKSSLDPDAKAYIAEVVTRGGTVNGTQRNVINTFYRTGKSDGWYSSMKRLYLPIWGIAAANAICMTSLTSGTFMGGVTHGAGYVLSNRTNGYMRTSVGIRTLGLSKDSYHFAGLYKASSTKNHSSLFGSQFDMYANLMSFSIVAEQNTQTITAMSGYAPAIGEVKATIPWHDRLGIFTFSGGASSRFLKRRKTSGVTLLGTTDKTIAIEPNNLNVAFLANNVNGAILGFCGEQIGAFSLGLKLTDAQDTSYSLALKNLWEGTTGLTLP